MPQNNPGVHAYPATPPVAIPGMNRTVPAGTVILLDSRSSAYDGTITFRNRSRTDGSGGQVSYNTSCHSEGKVVVGQFHFMQKSFITNVIYFVNRKTSP